MYEITCNEKGSRTIQITETHLQTISRYHLLSDLLDSNGMVTEEVLEKLRLNVTSLLNHQEDADLVEFCSQVLFHNNMKAVGLHNLILLFINWSSSQETANNIVSE